MPRLVRVLVIFLVLAVSFAGGCRRPDPVYDRIPRPISTRDLVRSERRAGPMFSESEWSALLAAHDRYVESYEALRRSDIASFLADVRDVPADAAFADPIALRRRIGRHASIVSRIAALDALFLSEADAAFGPSRAATIAALRNRRSLDRTNALSQGDGGKVLLDLRSMLDRLAFDESTLALIAPDLAAHATTAAQLADRIGQEQMHLPVRYLDVLQEKGRPEDLVDPRLDGDARNKAVGGIQQERYAASRRTLEVLLTEYADAIDTTLANIAPRLSPEDAARLERRLLRLRVDDDTGRSSDMIAFEALVASRTTSISPEVRDRIAGMREHFLADDSELLRRALAVYREGKVPGTLEPGGREATQSRKDRRAAIDRERSRAAKEFRDAVFALVPVELREKLGDLRNRNRNELAAVLTEFVGAARVPALVARKPRGFGDGDPPGPPDPPSREADGNGMAMLLPASPSDRDLLRFLTRAALDADARDVLHDLFVAWRDHLELSRDEMRARSEKLMREVIAELEGGSTERADRAIGRLLGVVDGMRRERTAIDDSFFADVEAAIPGVSPAAIDLWRWERHDLNWRLRWDDLPSDEILTFASESTLVFFDVLADAELPPELTAVIADALRSIAPELEAAGEAMRRDALDVIREVLRVMVEARKKNIRPDDALARNDSAVRRALTPLKSSSRRVAQLHSEALDLLAAALPSDDARRLRERYVAAAYPRVFDESRSASAAIEGMRNDPDLDAAQRADVERIAEARSSARESAIARLRTWGQDPAITSVDLRPRESLGRRQPAVAAATFAREEADARALRACLGLLRPEQRERHSDLSAWFDEQGFNVRGYD